ncbi:MAG: L-serine ammonia-lyase [Parachlamydiales bacterium]|nr:L-serine ammonia-lyase [Parachlamydiales bacterium]
MSIICTSLFELFKVGPGPSSSHTIGPMKAGLHFRKLVEKLPDDTLEHGSRIEVHLFGSLSATGKGHGTDRAVTGGLLGWTPETCDADALQQLLSKEHEEYVISIRSKKIFFKSKHIFFDKIKHPYPFQNTLIIKLMGERKVILEREYYSTGGGFLQVKGEPPKAVNKPQYPYSNMAELKKILEQQKISLRDLMMTNEQSLTGLSWEEIDKKLDHIIDVMEHAVENGLKKEGLLPGPIRLHRKASTLYKMAQSSLLEIPDRFFVFLDAYALAASEENAAGNLIVTAPTSGSSGVIPALLYSHKHYLKKENRILREGLLASAAIGFVAKHNASISGAEVGCQGEIGVAASMGAAFLSKIAGCSIQVIENAAEIALEHNLGMTCDPIGGYVQIPCIERNAVGAIDAYNAYLLASTGDPKKHKLSFDQVVQVMLETGRDMSTKYKETSKGGLALCDIYC